MNIPFNFLVQERGLEVQSEDRGGLRVGRPHRLNKQCLLSVDVCFQCVLPLICPSYGIHFSFSHQRHKHAESKLAWRPSHLTTSEDVKVKVEDRLTAISSVVDLITCVKLLNNAPRDDSRWQDLALWQHDEQLAAVCQEAPRPKTNARGYKNSRRPWLLRAWQFVSWG